jgi:hypothetical protein
MVGLRKVLGVARTGRAGHVVAGRRDAVGGLVRWSPTCFGGCSEVNFEKGTVGQEDEGAFDTLEGGG